MPSGEVKVQFSVVGQVEPYDDVFVKMGAVPREGETVDLPGLSQAETIVRTVVWYPITTDEGKPKTKINDDPDVYIVLGQRRP